MNVLFLGGVFDETMEKEILNKSKGTVQYAANKFQWNLINGFLEIDSLKLTILSAPFIGSFPKDYVDIKYTGLKSVYKNKVECNYVGFNNIWGYRSISRKNNLIKSIKNFALNKSNNKSIIVYSPHTPFLQAAVYAKKIDPSIHICLVVPDLPQFMNLNINRTFIYDILKRIDINMFEESSKYVDSFVLLTEPMKSKLNAGDRPYVVVEGVVNAGKNNDEDQINDLQNTEDIMTVVYTGTLNKKFGVINLAESFHNANIKNVHLKICGKGDSEEIIREYVSRDQRIKFLGQVSNNEAVELQKKATVLVNPRQNNEEFTKYSFPSKNMEYLLTGRPVIAYKLDGIPDEYDNYFYYVENDTVESLTRKIEEVLLMEKEKRNEFGAKARSFVLREKNNVSASKKIIGMIQKSRSR